MGLDVAIDELYSTRWTGLDTRGCDFHSDGRSFPTQKRVEDEFALLGMSLSMRHIQLFDCYRAEWRDERGTPQGAVVGQTPAEAAVYALSQARKLVTWTVAH